jgi:hypothetical protein
MTGLLIALVMLSFFIPPPPPYFARMAGGCPACGRFPGNGSRCPRCGKVA